MLFSKPEACKRALKTNLPMDFSTIKLRITVDHKMYDNFLILNQSGELNSHNKLNIPKLTRMNKRTPEKTY